MTKQDHVRIWLNTGENSPRHVAIHLSADVVVLGDALQPFHTGYELQGLSDWRSGPHLPPTGVMLEQDNSHYEADPVLRELHAKMGTCSTQ